jgi:hypothetical protein
MTEVWDEDVISGRQVRNWFEKYRSGDTSLEDKDVEVDHLNLMMTS